MQHKASMPANRAESARTGQRQGLIRETGQVMTPSSQSKPSTTSLCIPFLPVPLPFRLGYEPASMRVSPRASHRPVSAPPARLVHRGIVPSRKRDQSRLRYVSYRRSHRSAAGALPETHNADAELVICVDHRQQPADLQSRIQSKELRTALHARPKEGLESCCHIRPAADFDPGLRLP